MWAAHSTGGTLREIPQLTSESAPPFISHWLGASLSTPTTAASIMCSWLPIRLTKLSAGDRRLVDQPVDHLGTVRAAIDVIAEMHQRDMFGWPGGDVFGNHLMQRHQAVETAVNVANSVDSLAGGQGGWGGTEFDHNTATLMRRARFRQSSLGGGAQLPYPDDNERDPGRRTDKTLWRCPRGRRHQLHRPGWVDAGPARRQRRRKDHHHRHDARFADPNRRPHHRARVTTWQRTGSTRWHG